VKTLRPESVPAIGLRDAVAGLGVLGEAGTICVTGVCLDSRLVRPGDLYVAMTRPTRRLHLVSRHRLPDGLTDGVTGRERTA